VAQPRLSHKAPTIRKKVGNRQGPKVTHHTRLYHLGCLIIQEAHLSRKKANRRRRWEHSHVKARFCNRRTEEGEGIQHLMSWHVWKEERRRTNYKIMRWCSYPLKKKDLHPPIASTDKSETAPSHKSEGRVRRSIDQVRGMQHRTPASIEFPPQTCLPARLDQLVSLPGPFISALSDWMVS